MNKKAYIRTVEAVIAILLTFIFIMTILTPKESQKENTLSSIQKNTLKIIELNSSLRKNVLESQLGVPFNPTDPNRIQLYNTIKDNTKKFVTLDFNFTVCDQKNTNCNPNIKNDFIPKNKDVYAKSIMMSSLDKTRIFRLYLWEKF
ncbi:MAG: hypothetical protein PHD81_00460 [Candidatus Nanoarchaeia archaeon]|nr:hypothetical protein [Candidatus Nanoarchaeia archaeon]MDD5587562.1 hypothetical protein [Candidatus Nanoarchaeia archaeon]